MSMTYLLFYSNPWLFPAVMIVVLAVALEAPIHFGRRLVARIAIGDAAWNIVQAGVLTLVAFMLGISFSQSEERFDARRALVIKEANAIGTTWLRADQLAPRDSTRFRSILTDYTQMRLRVYATPRSPGTHAAAQAKSDVYQNQLWSMASSALRAEPQNLGRSLLMQTLNDTIDVSAEARTALTHHVPTSILTLTFILVVLGATLIGFGFVRSGANPRILGLVYLLTTVIVMEMIVDLDRPQTGFVRVNLDPLAQQLQSMQQQ